MPDYRAVYITAESPEQAAQIGRTLVEERLVACVNIIKDTQSIYWWQGSIQEDNESILIAKTHSDCLSALTDRVKALHSYDCPCVVSFALQENEGNHDYLEWIEAEAKGF